MLGSNRRIIIAIVAGLAIFAVGAYSQRAAIWANGPSAYPHYQETAEEAQKRDPSLSTQQAMEATRDQQPCRYNQGHDASDLCAQWSAADAAQRSSRWAWWQMVFSLAGIVGLMLTLWFNFEAWDQAREGKTDTERAIKAAEENAAAATRLAQIADNNAHAELRAYLDFNGVSLCRHPLPEPVKEGRIGMRLLIIINNYGKTPAKNVEAHVSYNFVSKLNRKTVKFAEDEKKNINYIAPTDHFKIQFFFGMTQYITECLENADLLCRLNFIITYQDVFGQNCVLRADFQGHGIVEEMGVIENTRIAT